MTFGDRRLYVDSIRSRCPNNRRFRMACEWVNTTRGGQVGLWRTVRRVSAHPPIGFIQPCQPNSSQIRPPGQAGGMR